MLNRINRKIKNSIFKQLIGQFRRNSRKIRKRKTTKFIEIRISKIETKIKTKTIKNCNKY